jgi:hypothetical protein
MIWRSKAIWTAVVDVAVSVSLFAVASYTQPPLSELLKIAIGGIQVISLALIAEFCIEKINQNLRAILSNLRVK